MEESDIALLDIQAKEKGVNRADLIRDRLFSDTPGRGLSLLKIFRVLLVASIAYPISLAVRWSGSSTQFLLRLCLSLGRQPPLFYKTCNSFLLLKVQGEQRMTDLAKFVLRFASVKITPETLQLEESTGGHPHNGR